MDYKNYTTNEGDTWPLVAYKAYGEAMDMAAIVDANPSVKIDPVLPAGIVLRIPSREVPGEVVSLDRLPPWKR